MGFGLGFGSGSGSSSGSVHLAAAAEGGMEVGEAAGVGARPHRALLVEQTEQADGPLGDEVDDRLVVLVGDEVPLHLLLDVHLLRGLRARARARVRVRVRVRWKGQVEG